MSIFVVVVVVGRGGGGGCILHVHMCTSSPMWVPVCMGALMQTTQRFVSGVFINNSPLIL